MDDKEARAILGAAGGPFELVTEDVRGRPTPVFKIREKCLRDKVANAAAHGDKEFLVYGDQRISYADFVGQVWGSAHALTEQHGLKKGDRIAILAFNQPDWLVTLFGATSAGAIAVGLNGWWASAELEYGLNDSGCRYLIVDEHLYERAAPILDSVESLETVFYIGDNPPEGTVPIKSLLTPRDEAPTTEIDEDDPFVILYTSGTTGRSKGCITTHRGTIAQCNGILHNFLLAALVRPEAEVKAGEAAAAAHPPATLLTSPLFHVAGLHSTVCTAMTGGAKLVFAPAKFDPEAVLGLIAYERVTMWMAIPTLLQRVVEHSGVGDYDLSALGSISTGGAAAPPDLLRTARAALATKPSMSTTYGLTECHGMATNIVGADLQRKPGSVGRPIPGMQVRIIDDDGADVATGVAGQILLGGATITPGYWNRPDANAETLRDGWLHTGDVGYLDDEGYLFISDRKKDMILRGGENVYCVEIENVLADHPEIVEAAIVGVPDKDLGERVKAVVRRTRDSDLPPAAVKEHAALHLAKFKVPEEIEFTDKPLPRNPAGKILKDVLKGHSKDRFSDQD